VVLRARRQWRLPALVFPVLAALLVVSGRRWGIALVLLAIPFLPAFWIRIEMNPWSIRRRDWRRRWSKLELDSVEGLRLRRLPFPAIQWLPRGYRIGRFWSVPLTLRLQYGEEVRFEIRCAWWDGWRDLAGYVAALPDMGLDARTRGRLGRYVGPIAFATSDQP
jgi:hypothetical protein